MAQLRKDRARKPLYDGRVNYSYGMRFDANGGAHGVTFRMNTDEGGFSLQITNDELDAAILTRQTFDDRPDPAFEAAAVELANGECDKDKRHGLSSAEQDRKALEMALTMLRTFMPKVEQARNGTLAYIATVAAEAVTLPDAAS